MTTNKHINHIYSTIASHYVKVNTFLTLGLDSYWRGKTAKLMTSKGGDTWLDVCCGTGDLTQLLSTTPLEVKIYASDMSEEMISLAKTRHYAKPIDFSLADSLSLPYEDNTFDQVVISFATRNLNASGNDITEYFSEFYRILKPGGHFVNLETSQPKYKFIRSLFHFYADKILPKLAYLLSGNKSPYLFLSSTMINFFPPEELKTKLLLSGFSSANYIPLTLGMCAIHIAEK